MTMHFPKGLVFHSKKDSLCYLGEVLTFLSYRELDLLSLAADPYIAICFNNQT